MNAKYLLLLLWCIPVTVYSENNDFYTCNGVISNVPCDAVKDIPVVGKELSAEERELAIANSRKSSLLHDVTMKSIEAKRSYSIDSEIDLKAVQYVCEDKNSSVSDCYNKTSALEEKINSRVLSEKKLKAKNDEIAAIKAKTEEKNNSTAVVIVNRPPPPPIKMKTDQPQSPVEKPKL